MQQTIIQLGSNVGNRLQHLQVALTHIQQQVGNIVLQSSIYETEPWGNTQQNGFLNQIIEVHTSLKPQTVLKTLLQIEETMGRVRTIKYAPRIIDLDILFVHEQVLQTEQLQIPHPQIAFRRFVLVPLAECWPNLIHPVLQKNMQQLLASCTDEGNVQKFYLHT